MTVTLKENGCKNRGNSWPHLATAVLYHLRSRPLTTTLRPFQIFGCKAAAARRWPCELHKHNGWKKKRVLELMAVSTLDDVCFPLKLSRSNTRPLSGKEFLATSCNCSFISSEIKAFDNHIEAVSIFWMQSCSCQTLAL